ncbi:MAG: aminotransferase class I/II-fold pyridoxal phosphate-dependent enzyme, partial [Gammaproteobacteria bacterium]|nr:aminotransferase class I/II-fold pyridoxal phosphate-dependent enzyme [Gammaproteobacteria bacterium]
MHLAPWPHYDEETIAAVADVLRSGRVNYWTGEQIVAFEQEFADFCGMPHALGVANGTVALELALIAAGIGPGDEVIVPARSFVATAGCVVNRGARPVFADIDEQSHNIS